MTSTRGEYAYRESGLDHVFFTDIEQRQCAVCGDSVVSIPQMPALHRSLAKELIQERRPLIGGEVAFLRKHLDLTQEALAVHLGLSAFAQRLWEEDHAHAQEDLLRVLLNAGDRLLRVLVAYRLEISLDIFKLFPAIKRQHGDVLPTFEVAQINGVWAVTRHQDHE
jgi:DNA-binding transcriptional regulator YiaG